MMSPWKCGGSRAAGSRQAGRCCESQAGNSESQNQVISITDDCLCSGIQFTLEAAVEISRGRSGGYSVSSIALSFSRGDELICM